MKATHGLVIGKFYPPHLGHHHLIDVAAQGSERLTVLVLGRSDEGISIAQRVQILSAVHAHQPHVEVVGARNDNREDYNDVAVWDAHQAVIDSALAMTSNWPVDVVFTSESYGDELARRLGALHVAVDPERVTKHVSGTLVRANPLGYQYYLSRAASAALARRVVILGAESTGSTTLSERLTLHYQFLIPTAHTSLVPEYGHDYCLTKLALAAAYAEAAGEAPPDFANLTWTDAEFTHIAGEQQRQEDIAALSSGLLLICDTDAFTTQIWQERYIGHVTDAVASLARPHDLYLVTHHDDVPFVQDGTRDGEHLRSAMTDLFISRLERDHRPYQVLTGSLDERLAQAVSAVDTLLTPPWWFTPDYATAPLVLHHAPAR